MFIATLFKITELLKQPECTSAGEWIDNLCDMSILWSSEKSKFFLYAITRVNSQMHYGQCKEPGPKGYIFYNRTYTTFRKGQKKKKKLLSLRNN